MKVAEKVTEYTYRCLNEKDSPDYYVWDVTAQYRGDGLWAVMHGPYCLSRDGAWDTEPLPSSRSKAWLGNHRFFLEEARQVARRIAPLIMVNGYTPDDILAKRRGETRVGPCYPNALDDQHDVYAVHRRDPEKDACVRCGLWWDT